MKRTTSDTAGVFSFADGAPVTYVIVATKKPFSTTTVHIAVGTQPVPPVALTLEEAAASEVEEVTVVGKCLDIARNGLSPETGSSTYRFTAEDIAQLPQGENTPLNTFSPVPTPYGAGAQPQRGTAPLE